MGLVLLFAFAHLDDLVRDGDEAWRRMTARDILRMLAPVIGEERTNRLWRAYLISDVKERRDLECMFEAYAALALRDVPSGGAVGLFPPRKLSSILRQPR
jgi:hypothetical protein